jgi:hypothetical protein
MRPSLPSCVRLVTLKPPFHVSPESVKSMVVPGYNHFSTPCRKLVFKYNQIHSTHEGMRYVERLCIRVEWDKTGWEEPDRARRIDRRGRKGGRTDELDSCRPWLQCFGYYPVHQPSCIVSQGSLVYACANSETPGLAASPGGVSLTGLTQTRAHHPLLHCLDPFREYLRTSVIKLAKDHPHTEFVVRSISKSKSPVMEAHYSSSASLPSTSRPIFFL